MRAGYTTFAAFGCFNDWTADRKQTNTFPPASISPLVRWLLNFPLWLLPLLRHEQSRHVFITALPILAGRGGGCSCSNSALVQLGGDLTGPETPPRTEERPARLQLYCPIKNGLTSGSGLADLRRSGQFSCNRLDQEIYLSWRAVHGAAVPRKLVQLLDGLARSGSPCARRSQ